MRNHGTHSYVMIGLLAAGAVLFSTGNAGGLVFLLWPVACMAMMVWMMWGMRGTGSAAAAPVEHTHDDGLKHAHDQDGSTAVPPGTRSRRPCAWSSSVE